jgi:hypothetical protein
MAWEAARGPSRRGRGWYGRWVRALPATSFVAGMLLLQACLMGELRELGQAISRDIYLESPNVVWQDIVGLEDAKRYAAECTRVTGGARRHQLGLSVCRRPRCCGGMLRAGVPAQGSLCSKSSWQASLPATSALAPQSPAART